MAQVRPRHGIGGRDAAKRIAGKRFPGTNGTGKGVDLAPGALRREHSGKSRCQYRASGRQCVGRCWADLARMEPDVGLEVLVQDRVPGQYQPPHRTLGQYRRPHRTRGQYWTARTVAA
eukprot:2282491-Rhodomonas_salina.2